MNNADRSRLAGRWFLALLAGSIVLHAIFAMVLMFTPWGQRTMGFDTRAHEEHLEEIAHLEELREEYERERRDRIKLKPEQAEELRKHEEEQRRDLLKDNVKRLVKARERALKERDEAFDRIRDRKEEELLPNQIERLREELNKAIHKAHQPSREAKHKEEAERMRDDLKDELKRLDQIKKRAEAAAEEGRKDAKAAEDFKKAAKEIGEKAEEYRERYREMQAESGGSLQHRTKGAAEGMEDLKEESDRHVDGVDADRMNDTSDLDEIGDVPAAAASDEAIAAAPPADLYDAARELEQQIDAATQQADAADFASLQGSSVGDAMNKTEQASPPRPDLGETMRNPGAAQAGQGSADSSGSEDADSSASNGSESASASASTPAGGAGVQTVGDLHRYREAIQQATTETTDMARRAERKTGGSPTTAMRGLTSQSPADRARHEAMAAASRTAGQRNRHQLVDMTGLQLGDWTGGELGSSRIHGLTSGGDGGGEMIGGTGRQSKFRLKEEEVAANALPGRMLTDASSRQGFLYLDTWYVIGPWDNWSRADFEIVHPPEKRIDLDAEYHDGKFANRPNHPDHVLRWHFVQSDRMAIQPPRPMHSATFYAYTEVYSDRTREMLVAVASDDMAKVWLNGDVIWTDVGQSGWNLDEGFRKVIFKEGFNEVLVRFENGPAFVAFSVVLCPPEALQTGN